MKPSKYNFFVHYEPDDVYIGYNAVSGGLYIFNSAQYREAAGLLSGVINNDLPGQVKQSLVEGRFLVADDTDEINILKLRNNLTRFNPVDLAMVISPTLECVFDCPYCYVDREKSKMTKETINALKKFYSRKIEEANIVNVSWTGGEPLLAFDVVEELNLFFEEKAMDKSIRYKSNMITNGYLLTPPMVERVKKANIRSLQITLDGYKDYHDRYRYTAGGGSTYQKILENVVFATENGLTVTLRTNVSKDNFEGIYQLIDELALSGVNQSKCIFTPCMVSNIKETSKPCSCNVFTNPEFSKFEVDIILYALKKGFGFVEQKLSAMRTYCGANTMPLFVIDSHANVLKCWCNLGRSEKNKIGSINEEGEFIISNFNALARWMSMDPFTNSICLECSVLPICMGGCIYYQVADNYDSFEDGCSHLRYNLESILKLLYISKTKTAEQLKNINLTNIGGYYEHA